ncbi:MAG: type I methionyl aminopeptidase [Symbiobacteriia bacterium]
MIILKSDREIQAMREAGRLTALAHQEVAKAIAPGVTTMELDRVAEAFIRQAGGQPSFKGYLGYPGSICASVNHVVVHGIPSQHIKLQEGDILSVDIGVFYGGFHGDAARTWPVGVVGPEAERLLRVTEESLQRGLAQVKAGGFLTDIGHAVQTHVESQGFTVVRDYVGHGIGTKMHEDPQIPNFGAPGQGPQLRAGMVLAIEPMVNAGGYAVRTLADGWTVVTTDSSLSAHFEHTVALTDRGAEILTLP